MSRMISIPIGKSGQPLIPIDKNDPKSAITAQLLDWPFWFCDKAKKVIEYFDGTAFYYYYKNQFVVTDESLYLTSFGDGTPEAPIGFPRFVGEDPHKVEEWLVAVYDELKEDGEL